MGIHSFGLMLMTSVGYRIFSLLFGAQSSNPDLLLFLNILGTSVFIPLFYELYLRDERIRSRYKFRSFRSLRLPEGILLLLFGAALSHYVNDLFSILDFFRALPKYTESINRITGQNSIVWIILWSGIAAPVSEELTFRWLIYRRLRDYLHVWPAVILSSLLFGLYHGNAIQFFYAFIMGIFLSWTTEWTKNMKSCILFHMGANLWSLVISYSPLLYLNPGFTLLILWLLIAVILFTPLYFLVLRD